MSEGHLNGSGRPGPEGGAERLLALVRAGCSEVDGMPARLEAGLRIVLGALAVDPELARRLTVEPCPGGADGPAAESGREWVSRFGVLLGDAATADPRASREPDFVAPFLLGGVRFQIARLVLAGETSDLLRLLPGTLEGLLAYWFEPGEPRALARAALAAAETVGGAVDEDPKERFRRTIRFADLARRLGVDLPPFRGPLVAFDPARGRSTSGPVFLGGDLHAIHPDMRDPGGPPDRDESLDLATISLLDGEGWLLDLPATDGVWCTRLEGPALECAPYFSITDGRGRLRIWLILPPAPTMIGIAHLWLGAVPAADPRSRRSSLS